MAILSLTLLLLKGVKAKMPNYTVVYFISSISHLLRPFIFKVLLFTPTELRGYYGGRQTQECCRFNAQEPRYNGNKDVHVLLVKFFSQFSLPMSTAYQVLPTRDHFYSCVGAVED